MNTASPTPRPQLVYLVFGAETYHQEAVFSIASALAHLGGPIEDWWRDLGAPSMDAALQHQVVDGVAQALGTRQATELARARDALLIDLLRAKQSSGALD